MGTSIQSTKVFSPNQTAVRGEPRSFLADLGRAILAANNGTPEAEGALNTKLDALSDADYLTAALLCQAASPISQLEAIKFLIDNLQTKSPKNVYGAARMALFLARLQEEQNEAVSAFLEETKNSAEKGEYTETPKEVDPLPAEPSDTPPSLWKRAAAVMLALSVTGAAAIVLRNSLRATSLPQPTSSPKESPLNNTTLTAANIAANRATPPRLPLDNPFLGGEPVTIKAPGGYQRTAYFASCFPVDPNFRKAVEDPLRPGQCPSLQGTPTLFRQDWRTDVAKERVAAERGIPLPRVAVAVQLPTCSPGEAPPIPDSAKQLMAAPSRAMTAVTSDSEKQVATVESVEQREQTLVQILLNTGKPAFLKDRLGRVQNQKPTTGFTELPVGFTVGLFGTLALQVGAVRRTLALPFKWTAQVLTSQPPNIVKHAASLIIRGSEMVGEAKTAVIRRLNFIAFRLSESRFSPMGQRVRANLRRRNRP